jgi:hypothetical protein
MQFKFVALLRPTGIGDGCWALRQLVPSKMHVCGFVLIDGLKYYCGEEVTCLLDRYREWISSHAIAGSITE